jgi:hypothetical protein
MLNGSIEFLFHVCEIPEGCEGIVPCGESSGMRYRFLNIGTPALPYSQK